jgi:DNA-binding NarL/FixJ family response regulator
MCLRPPRTGEDFSQSSAGVILPLTIRSSPLSPQLICCQIEGDSALKMVPVVMMTSSREEQDLPHSYQLGVNACVVKPMKFQDFVEAARQVGAFWEVINEVPPGSVQRIVSTGS